MNFLEGRPSVEAGFLNARGEDGRLHVDALKCLVHLLARKPAGMRGHGS